MNRILSRVAAIAVTIAWASAASGTGTAAPSVPASASSVSLRGMFIAFQHMAIHMNWCFGNAEDFLFHVDGPIGDGEFARIRYIWEGGETPPPEELRRADRSWRLTVVRNPSCDTTIDELRWTRVISTDGGPTPLIPYFDAAEGPFAQDVPPGTRLVCYELRGNGLR